MPAVTAHCIIKNEEDFVGYAIRSIINFVDLVIVFDTGSTDKTVQIVQNLMREYPNKILFEEKGLCNKKRHTELRQEMLNKTITDWFMILDGDEVWTNQGMEEALGLVKGGKVDYIQSNFYECVGDIFHTHRKPGYKTVRFFKSENIKWQGDYGGDLVVSKVSNHPVDIAKTAVLLTNKFWHLTHLRRSFCGNDDYSSGGSRKEKRRLTYFIIGRKIIEPIPEVFSKNSANFRMSWSDSFINFFKLVLFKNKYYIWVKKSG
ncbi:MAG: glycosyltransferase [Candidatus Magasanikbacteria bacterium]